MGQDVSRLLRQCRQWPQTWLWMVVATRSPGRKSCTSDPSLSTVPATSWPRITGISTPRRKVPLRTTTSWKHTPQAATAILISRGPGSRAATSATRMTSGGPVPSVITARI